MWSDHERVNRTIPLIILGYCLLAAVNPVRGGWDDGEADYLQGDYARAFKAWQPLAEQGDARAQYNLGLMYHKGLGISQDDITAVKWFRQAAEQRLASGQCALGYMYDAGLGVPQDYYEAMQWYRAAADQGDATARFNLGRLYYTQGRAIQKPRAGLLKRLNRVMLLPASTWPGYMLMEQVCHRTPQRP